jgi:energy-converting hydrogenase Eha subunit B
MLFGKSNRWFYLSWAINAFILIIVSYEYLTMNSAYLLAVSLIAFLTIGTLSYSRLSKSTEEIATTQEQINWPRVETF